MPDNPTLSLVIKADATQYTAALNQAQTSLAGLGEAVKTAGDKLNIRPFAAIQADIKSLEAAYDTLKESGAASASELYRAHESMRSGVARLNSEMGSLGAILDDSKFKLAGLVAAVAGVVAALNASASTAMGFGSAMAKISATIELTPEQFQKLRKDVLDLSSSMGLNAVEAVGALQSILKKGIPPENAIDMLRMSAKAAIGGLSDLSTTSSSGMAIMRAYGMTIQDIPSIFDTLKTASDHGRMSFDDLNKAIVQVLPVATKVNIPFDELSAILTRMGRSGMDAGSASALLTRIISELSAPASAAGTEMRKLGIEWTGLRGTLQTIAEKNLALQIMKDIAPDARSLSAVISLTNGIGSLGKSLDDIHKGAGSMESAYKIIRNTPEERIKEFNSALDGLKIAFGDAWTGSQTLTKNLTELIREFNALDSWVKDGILALAGYGGAAAVLIAGLVILKTTLGFIWAELTVVAGRAGAAATALIDMAASARLTGASLSVTATGMNATTAAIDGLAVSATAASRALGLLKNALLIGVAAEVGYQIGKGLDYAFDISTKIQPLLEKLFGAPGQASAKVYAEKLREIALEAMKVNEKFKDFQILDPAKVAAESKEILEKYKGDLGNARDYYVAQRTLAVQENNQAAARAAGEMVGKYQVAINGAIEGIRKLSGAGASVSAALKTELEALGVDVGNLSGGVSTASASAITSFRLIANSADSTGEQVKAAFDAALSKTKFQEDVSALIQELVKAADQGKITGDELAQAALESKNKYQELARQIEGPVGTAFKTLGIDIGHINGTVSDAALSSVQSFRLIATSAESTGSQIRAAMEGALSKVKWKEDLDALKASLNAAADAGKITGAELARALDGAAVKSRELAGQIEGSVGDAFKRLGVKTSESLKAAFDQAKADYEKLKESGLSTAGALEAAHKKLGDAAKEAFAGIAADSQRALEAEKNHTTAIQASSTAISAKAKATEASANAQKADADYAEAAAKANKEGSAAAQAQAAAKSAAATAAHASAEAAEADAKASQDAAKYAQAEEAAKKAAAKAAAEPTKANEEAATAAQNLANNYGQAAEQSKQAAIAANDNATQTKAAASAAAAQADQAERAAKAAKEAADAAKKKAEEEAAQLQKMADIINANMANLHSQVMKNLEALGHSAEEAGKIIGEVMKGFQGMGEGVLKGAENALNNLIAKTSDDLKNQKNTLDSIGQSTNNLGKEAAQVTENFANAGRRAQGLGAAVKEFAGVSSDPKIAAAYQAQAAAAKSVRDAYESVKASALSAAQSAASAAQSFASSAGSVHMELLNAQGRETEAIQEQFKARKAQLELSYVQLDVQLRIAEAQAMAAGVGMSEVSKARADMNAAKAQEQKDLAELERIATKKAEEKAKSGSNPGTNPEGTTSRAINTATAPADKATATPPPVGSALAANSGSLSPVEGRANPFSIPGSNSPLQPPDLSVYLPPGSSRQEPSSRSSISESSTTTKIQFIAPGGSGVTGNFGNGDVQSMLNILKEAGARAVPA